MASRQAKVPGKHHLVVAVLAPTAGTPGKVKGSKAAGQFKSKAPAATKSVATKAKPGLKRGGKVAGRC